MSKKNIKSAKARLQLLGIVEDDPRYTPRQILVRYKTVPAAERDPLTKISALTKDLSQTKFHRVPVFQRINPYRQLLDAMVDGIYTEELRAKLEKLGRPND